MEYLKSTLKILDSSTSKITQKRNAANELLETLSKRSIIEELNNNHLTKTSICWDNVLRVCQRYIIGEADRCIDSERLGKAQTQASDRVIVNCRILATRVIEHSSSSDFLYLTRGSTLECIFEVLDNPKYHKYYLKTYLDILTSILLRVEHFVYYLRDSEWKEIIRILKEICLKEDHDDETRHGIIRSLIHIFEHAPTYLLRSWCSFIVKQWEIAKECQQLKRSTDLLKMTQVYCEKVACDLRQSLCKLGEEIFPQVLSCYEDRIEDYGGPKTTVFDFLLLQVTLHHPDGATQDSDLAYANDWIKWKSFLGQIYSKICQEAEVYNRNLKNMKFIDLQKNDSLIWYNYRRLAVEVLIQREFNLLQRLNSHDGGEGTSMKRVRHSSAIEIIFDEIKPGSCIPWLSILQLYISRHSDKINLSNYTLILSRLLSYEFTIKMERHFQFQCYLALLEIENRIEHGVNKSELNNLWMKVWENTVRSFGHNENEDLWVTLTNKLLQSKPVDALSLLRVLNSKKLTIHHIQILNTVYYTNPLSNDKNDLNYRYTLWETILNSCIDTNDMKSKQDVYQSDITAQILIGLILKQFPLIEIRSNRNENENYLDNLENVYTKSTFSIKTKNTCKLSSESAKDLTYRVDERFKNDFMEYLLKFHERFEEIRMKPMKLVEKIQITIDILIFSLNLLTVSFQFNVINDTSTFPLIKTIQTFLPFLNDNFTQGIEKNLITLHEKIDLIEHMMKLFDIKLHSKFFTDYSSLDVKLFSLLNKLYLLIEDGHADLLKSQNGNMNSKNTGFLTKFNHSEKLLPKEERLVLRSFNTLCNYIFKPNFNNTTPVQGKLLNILQESFLADLKFKNVIDLKIGFMFSSTIIYSTNSVPNELLVNVFNILDSILKANEHYFVVVLQIFEIFKEILKYVAKSNNNQLKNIAHKFLNTLYSTEKHGPKIFKTILLTMKEMIMINPQFNWTTGDDGRFSTWDKLVTYTYCPYHDIRLLAVDIIYDIFNSDNFTIHMKKSFFTDIDKNIKKVLKVNDSETDEYSMEDERNFRVGSILYTYTLIACSDSRILPDCLFSIINYAAKLSTAKVQPSIKYILDNKKEENLKNFFASHLEYLITKWCSGKHGLDKFPYKILGYNTDLDFFSENLPLTVPLFLKKNSVDILTEICRKLNKNLKAVIEELFPELFVEILPLIASKTPLTYIDESIRTELNFLKINLFEMLTEYDRTELIQIKLQDILFNLIKKFDDSNYFHDKFNILLTNNTLQNNQLYFKYNTVKECIEFLEIQRDNKDKFNSFITMFAKISPNFFQKCLLKLSKPIYKSTYQHEQLLAFQQYIFFCKWIENYFQSQELKPVLQFILRDIIHTAINIITNSNQSDQLRMATCKYFIKFCETCIQTDEDIFKEHCHFIINSISPLTKNQTAINLHQNLFDLLKILIVDNKETITESISQLEPFSDEDDKFRMLNEIYDAVRYNNTNNEQNLENEIKIFLKIQNFENVSRLESLKRLHKLLERQKDDLFRIYNQLKIQQGSFEMCRNSILHNLIISLIELSYSSDEEVKLMAAKCLGELGPSNLRTLILKVDFTQLVNSLDIDISLVIAGVVIQLLANYIVDKDWDIREMASEALYAILSSPEGYCIIYNKPENFEDIIGPINSQHIYPFITSDMKYEISEEFLFCVSNEFFNNLQDSDLWLPLYKTQEGHESWLKTLMYNILKLIDRPRYIQTIIQLCEKKIQFAEKLLPVLIEMLLCKITNKKQIEIINNKISFFFQNIFNNYRVHHKSLKVMLDVVNLNKLRSHRNHTTDDKNFLDINYLHIAKAAYDCSSYFTAVFYAELWCRQKIQSSQQYRKDTRRLNIIEYICQQHPDEGEIMQKILRQSYTNIDDPDAVHGCGMSHLYNMEDRVEHYSKMGRWDQSVLYNDFVLSTTRISNPLLENAYRLSLKHAGLYNTANIYTKTTDYECLWRMQNWTLNKVTKDDDESFERNHYFALKNIYDQEPNYEHLKVTRKLILKSLQYNLETTKNLYNALSRLQLLQEIEDFSKDYSFKNFNEIIFKWDKQSQMESKDFHYLEPIYNQRITLLEIAFNKTNETTIQNHLINFQINLAETARKQKWFQVARMALLKLKHVNNIENIQKCKIQLEEAQLEWNLNLDRNIGRSLLRNLLSSDFGGDKLLRSKAYRLYGTWMMETQAENPNVYFEEALNTLDRFNLHGEEENENRYSSYAALAKFSDNEHQEVKKYLNSQAYEIKQSCILKAKELCANFEAKYNKDVKAASEDERRMYFTNKRNCALDEADIENYQEMFNKNLLMAAKYYLLCLIKCENYNLSIFRLFSLWLENRNHDELNDLIGKQLQLIPTLKFLQVLPQIAPHITNSPADGFAEQVNDIIEKCAIDHPHHVLPIIFALANATKDNEFLQDNNNKKSTSASSTNTSSSHPRVLQAQIIIKKLSRNSKIKKIVISMDAVSDALIKLAYLDEKRQISPNTKQKIPSNHPILKLQNLDHVQFHTLDLPVKPSTNYEDIVGIYKWQNEWSTPGGLNKPKKVICIGSDGVARNQMVKGKDDLRQDAVMQQVFSILNTLLTSNDLRHLTIRTYKVVPLSRKSGILQWCDNTLPLSSYLIGGQGVKGAHAKYHPEDYTYLQCVEKYKAVSSKDNERKLHEFNNICAHFQPALHYFFFEKFGSSAAFWWERRRAYTLSVAATSMIGYILGLGDRHLSNILIDTSTAEVIHIDFGIAFDQGKVLPTPETIPFRLSRDIEDGMGISGVEGVFRRSCEKTMSVLRQNSEIIITILEVLLYDPLYLWNISVSTAMKIQARGVRQNFNATTQVVEDTEVNKMAERALLRLTQKLQGIENSRIMSVEGQVEQLIQEARNPVNLSRVFVGWSPFA